jgi:hypothetical protein
MKSKLCLVALVGFAAGVAVSVWLRPQQEVRAETSSKPKLEYRLEPLSLPPPPATTRGNTPAPRVETPQQTADRVSRAINKLAADGWEYVAVVPAGQSFGTFVMFKRGKK